jgi:zinc transporter
MPLCAFDIHPDGTTTEVGDKNLQGKAAYRWWHYDLSDADLPTWLEATLPDIPAGALIQSETRPRCDRYNDGIILNLRGVNMNSGQDNEDMISLRAWVVKNAIVTVRIRKVFAVDDIRHDCTLNAAPPSVADFLVRLVEGLTGRIETIMLEEDAATDIIEESILAVSGNDKVEDFGPLRRKAIKLRRYLGPQRDAVVKLAGLDSPILTDPARNLLRETANRTTLVVEGLDSIRERLTAMQDHADTQTAARLGRNSYGLSVIAAVFLPLGFLTGLFGVNVGGMPGIDSPWAFIILSTSMFLIAILAIWILRKVNWL